MGTVHAVVPVGIDDPARPSGGNVYDRQICDGLAATGWVVREHHVAGGWPWPDAAAEAALAGIADAVAPDAVLLVDGLIAASAPDAVVRPARRAPLVVLAHMVLGDRPAGHEVPAAHNRERAALRAASAVVTTSEWLRDRLLDRYALPPGRVHVATPGVEPAEFATGTAGGGRLLCVAPVAAHKGHDVLLAALATIADLPWGCTCVGPLDRDPAFVARLRARAALDGIGSRLEFRGPSVGAELDRAYAAADVLVVASRAESYGMVVVEALARGLPVIATDVGGLPEALGTVAAGRRPGLLVPSGDPAALGRALRRWLTEPRLRATLRAAAGERRGTLRPWPATSADIARVLAAVPGVRPPDELDGRCARMPL